MKSFPTSASEIWQLGLQLVEHLKAIPDTHIPKDWTSANFTQLRSFDAHGLDVVHYPASPDSNQKGAFLWDYIAYQQGRGILIAAESEHDSRPIRNFRHDFEKLFYAVAPIKLFMFRGDGNSAAKTQEFVNVLKDCMTECCSRFAPGELYILYCRTWQDAEQKSAAYFLQIPGEPNKICALTEGDSFVLVTAPSAL